MSHASVGSITSTQKIGYGESCIVLLDGRPFSAGAEAPAYSDCRQRALERLSWLEVGNSWLGQAALYAYSGLAFSGD